MEKELILGRPLRPCRHVIVRGSNYQVYLDSCSAARELYGYMEPIDISRLPGLPDGMNVYVVTNQWGAAEWGALPSINPCTLIVDNLFENC